VGSTRPSNLAAKGASTSTDEKGSALGLESAADLLGARRVQAISLSLLSGEERHKDAMEDIWVLGGLFLERFVTVFDFDGARIGFAEPTSFDRAAQEIAPLLNEAQVRPGRASASARLVDEQSVALLASLRLSEVTVTMGVAAAAALLLRWKMIRRRRSFCNARLDWHAPPYSDGKQSEAEMSEVENKE